MRLAPGQRPASALRFCTMPLAIALNALANARG